jgi:addiction module RelE/StbE family toxin
MAYRIEITETGQKEIYKKLDGHLIDRLNQRVKKLEIGPKIFGKPLRGPLARIWEIRFENRWRIFYKVHESEQLVQIIGLKHKDEM